MSGKLYHGTNLARLPSIQENGLMPRVKSRVKGNWSHTVTSNSKAVYLTDAYAWHFAACASEGVHRQTTDTPQQRGLILEIDKQLLLPWLLCPDEDWMEQASRGVTADEAKQRNLAPPYWSMKRRTMFYRKVARFNPGMAEDSLRGLGTAGYYGVVPWSAVTRYVEIDWAKMPTRFLWAAVDSAVHVMNYKILQGRHRAFLRWFFGDPVTPEEIDGIAGDEYPDGVTAEFTKHLKDQREATLAAMADRSGLTVCTKMGKWETEGKDDREHVEL